MFNRYSDWQPFDALAVNGCIRMCCSKAADKLRQRRANLGIECQSSCQFNLKENACCHRTSTMQRFILSFVTQLSILVVAFCFYWCDKIQPIWIRFEYSYIRFIFSFAKTIDAPSCSPNQPRIYGVAKQEQAQIRCNVDANPPDVEFKWTFNNSAESIDVASNHVTRSGKDIRKLFVQ